MNNKSPCTSVQGPKNRENRIGNPASIRPRYVVKIVTWCSTSVSEKEIILIIQSSLCICKFTKFP